jgi:hypothetical protein
MDWENFLGNGFGGDMLNMAFAGGASKTQGKWNRRLVKSENELARAHSIDMVKLGNQLDMANQKEMFDYRIQQGRDAGMTPYEMFMGPAAGAGGGTTGSGNTLGNQPAQLAANATQAANARLQAQTQLGTAMIQANAQREVAKTQADATTGAATIQADTQAAIAAGRLGFDKEVYYNTTAPKAAMEMGLTTQQVLKAANEVVTSRPEFIRMMKVFTMSAENLLATMTAFRYGDITDPKVIENMSEEQRENITSAIMSLLSQGRKEMSGVAEYFKGLVEGYSSPTDGIGNAWNNLGNGYGWSHPSSNPPADRRKSLLQNPINP